MSFNKSIGRNPNNDIVINDPNISEFHAQLKIGAEGDVYLIDLVSDKGTFVNGSRIEKPIVLNPSDTVSFGAYGFNWKENLDAAPKAKAAAETSNTATTNTQSNQQDDKKRNPIAETVKENYTKLKGVNYREKISEIRTNIFEKGDPEKKKKIWLISLTSIILLTFLSTKLAWFDNESGGMPGDTDTYSGLSYFFELLSQDFPEAPLITVKYLLVLLSIVAIFIGSLLLLLKLVNIWKSNMKSIENKLIKVVFYGSMTLVLSQIVVFIAVYARENAGWSIEDLDTLTLLVLENFGFGFWLTFVISIALFKFKDGAIYNESYSRKWLPLSVAFWMPIIMIFCFTSKSSGWLTTEVTRDYDSYYSRGDYGSSDSYEEYSTSGMQAMKRSAYTTIRITKGEYSKYTSPRMWRFRKKTNLQTPIFIGSILYFIVLILLLFTQSPLNKKSMVLAIAGIVLTIGLFIVFKQLISATNGAKSYEEVSLASGFTYGLVANVILVVQLFTTNSNRKNSEEKNKDVLDEVELT